MGVTVKSFDSPDELRSPAMARVEVVDLGPAKAARLTLQPGWSWSTSVKPIAGTDLCQSRHIGIVVSGRMRVRDADGNETIAEPGLAYVIDPGHDAWVEGEDQVVAYEFDSSSAATYATPQ